jgi:hypothetical protein
MLPPAILLIIGIALTLFAKPLSRRYYAFTTAFRERNPHINPPPTPEMRALNTRIMTRLFRTCGIAMSLMAALILLGSFGSLKSH